MKAVADLLNRRISFVSQFSWIVIFLISLVLIVAGMFLMSYAWPSDISISYYEHAKAVGNITAGTQLISGISGFSCLVVGGSFALFKFIDQLKNR